MTENDKPFWEEPLQLALYAGAHAIAITAPPQPGIARKPLGATYV